MLKPVRALFLRLSRLLAHFAGEDVTLRRAFRMEAGDEQPVVQLRLDRLRTLRLTMAEALEFKRRTGISMLRGLDVMALEEEAFLELLAVTAMHEDPDVTAARIAPHVHGQVFVSALAAIVVLANDFFPSEPKDFEGHPLLQGALAKLTSKQASRA